MQFLYYNASRHKYKINNRANKQGRDGVVYEYGIAEHEDWLYNTEIAVTMLINTCTHVKIDILCYWIL